MNLTEKAALAPLLFHTDGQIRYRLALNWCRAGQIEENLSAQVDFWRKR
jgi:hypothetical protein